MPIIEIISLRFNLAKEKDRKLFEALRERGADGRRNEFLKQVLFDSLVANSAGTNPTAQPSKKRTKGPAELPGNVTRPNAAEANTAKTGPEAAREKHQEADPDAAGLVSQFVQ